MRGSVLVDLRNIYDPDAMRQAGFAYHSVGRPANATVQTDMPQPIKLLDKTS